MAIPLMERDAKKAVIELDWRLAAGAAVPLADIFIKQKKYDAAWKWIENADDYLKKSFDRSEELMDRFYSVKSAWYLGKGNAVLATKYLDSARLAKDEEDNRVNALQLLRVQQKEHRQKLAAERSEFLAKEKSKNKLVFALMFIAFCLIAVSFLIYFLQRRKRLRIEATKDAKLKLASLELGQAKQQLEKFAQTIAHNSRMIEDMQTAQENQQSEAAALVRKKAIITDESWENFQHAFEKVHPGYIRRLKEKVSGVTLAETKMVVLSKLRLSKQEMAHALGISPQSLRVTWHRLRKKTGDDEILLEDFVDLI